MSEKTGHTAGMACPLVGAASGVIKDAADVPVAVALHADTEKRQAIRDEIIRRCNSHDELVAALLDAIPYIEGAYECAFPDADLNASRLESARAAIKNATGQA